MPILIDTAAAAAKPGSAELARWASDQRVFISSAMQDLAAERSAVASAGTRVGAEAVWFEESGGSR